MRPGRMLWPACLLLGAVWAATAAAQKLTPEQLVERLPGVPVDSVSEAPLDGFYQVRLGATIAYVSHDGRYVLQGEIYDLETSRNLTEQTRAQARIDLLAGVGADEMIVFAPKNGQVKHTITIFTDIDCGYCRQFHREIDKVNEMGIEVHYLFYPRSGPATESWTKADNVWCSTDRNAALTRAKLGARIPDATCDSTPVDEHFDLGRQVGVRGTPAIYAANGELIGGYLSPAQLLEVLEDLAE